MLVYILMISLKASFVGKQQIKYYFSNNKNYNKPKDLINFEF
jgi:hypothetical protein